MKKIITTATVLFSIFLSLVAQPDTFVMNDEAYIDDIPFNTEAIAKNHMIAEALQVDFYFAEESYIDDIPFNTREVIANHKAEAAMNVIYEIAQEEFIDDIPFNTVKIAFKALICEVICTSNI
jgi:hypothetical protein